MNGSWLDGIRDRLRGAWDVLLGRAYAGYSVPDMMDEVLLRAALIEIEELGKCYPSPATHVARAALNGQTREG